MNIPGKGWARRVTINTLSGFRRLLRTGTEWSAESQVGEEVVSDELAQDSLPASEKDLADRGTKDTTTLFDGIPVEVPVQFRSRPRYAGVPPSGSNVPPGPITVQPDASPHSTIDPLPLVPVRRWFKQMSAADAQRPLGQNTNPTGHLTLVQGGYPIQHASWFRDDLFSGADWTTFNAPSDQRERAAITFRMRIAGVDRGEIVLEVTHTPSFESHQGNRTTVVHWGTTMGNHLRQHDYTNYYITIERAESGEFLMVIDNNPTGPFVG